MRSRFVWLLPHPKIWSHRTNFQGYVPLYPVEIVATAFLISKFAWLDVTCPIVGKVGGSWFLWDYKCRHDTIIDIFLSRAGTIAIKFNDRIVSLIFDINHIYLLFKKIIFNKNDVYLQFNSIKLSKSTIYDWINSTFR